MSEPKLSIPVLSGPGASDYERYLRTDELLDLQKREDEWIHRDELLFQTVHQSSELWLKLAWHEFEEATRLVNADEIEPALRLLRRANASLRFTTDALEMLGHMSPWEYTTIRKVLGHGSGFDSPGFRAIRSVSPAGGNALRDAVERTGLTLADLYIRGREFDALYNLAEQLIEWDENVTIWRMRHVKVVERTIGWTSVGTQGNTVDVLRELIHKAFYPDLWEVRNELTRLNPPD